MVNASGARHIISPLNQLARVRSRMPVSRRSAWSAHSARAALVSRSSRVERRVGAPRSRRAPGPGASASARNSAVFDNVPSGAMHQRKSNPPRLRVRREPPRRRGRIDGWPRCRRRGQQRGEGAWSARGQGASRAGGRRGNRDGLGGAPQSPPTRPHPSLLGKRLRGDDRLRLPGRAVRLAAPANTSARVSGLDITPVTCPQSGSP